MTDPEFGSFGWWLALRYGRRHWYIDPCTRMKVETSRFNNYVYFLCSYPVEQDKPKFWWWSAVKEAARRVMSFL